MVAFMPTAFGERSEDGDPQSCPAWTVLLGTVGIGCLHKTAKHSIRHRLFDWEDIIFNSLAGAIAWLLVQPSHRFAIGKPAP